MGERKSSVFGTNLGEVLQQAGIQVDSETPAESPSVVSVETEDKKSSVKTPATKKRSKETKGTREVTSTKKTKSVEGKGKITDEPEVGDKEKNERSEAAPVVEVAAESSDENKPIKAQTEVPTEEITNTEEKAPGGEVVRIEASATSGGRKKKIKKSKKVETKPSASGRSLLFETEKRAEELEDTRQLVEEAHEKTRVGLMESFGGSWLQQIGAKKKASSAIMEKAREIAHKPGAVEYKEAYIEAIKAGRESIDTRLILQSGKLEVIKAQIGRVKTRFNDAESRLRQAERTLAEITSGAPGMKIFGHKLMRVSGVEGRIIADYRAAIKSYKTEVLILGEAYRRLKIREDVRGGMVKPYTEQVKHYDRIVSLLGGSESSVGKKSQEAVSEIEPGGYLSGDDTLSSAGEPKQVISVEKVADHISGDNEEIFSEPGVTTRSESEDKKVLLNKNLEKKRMSLKDFIKEWEDPRKRSYGRVPLNQKIFEEWLKVDDPKAAIRREYSLAQIVELMIGFTDHELAQGLLKREKAKTIKNAFIDLGNQLAGEGSKPEKKT